MDSSALTTSTCMVAAMFHALLKCFSFLERFLDPADHVESLLGQRVALAAHDHLETLDRFLERDVLAGRSGEHLGHEERLRKEALDFPRARDRELVFRRKLVHAENRDDVAKLLVALERRL